MNGPLSNWKSLPFLKYFCKQVWSVKYLPTQKQQQRDKKIIELKQAMTDNGTDQQTKI